MLLLLRRAVLVGRRRAIIALSRPIWVIPGLLILASLVTVRLILSVGSL